MRGWTHRGPPARRALAAPFRSVRGFGCACSWPHCPLWQSAWQLRARGRILILFLIIILIPHCASLSDGGVRLRLGLGLRLESRRSAKYVRAMIPTRLQEILDVKRAEVAKLLPRLAHLREAA